MKQFIGEQFLLHSDTAIKLYKSCKNLPIIDYHCHLDPKEIAENKRFNNITDLALGGDHYKWRLMRANGVEEKFITGNASDEEKFYHWCATIEDCIGNPLYHWTHLEMRRYFDYDGPINGAAAADIYAYCNKQLQQEDFSAWGIFKKFRIEQIGTTDDPADTLEHHKAMIVHRDRDPTLPLVSPTWRPSNIMNIEAPGFVNYVKKLKTVSGTPINNWEDLMTVLVNRLDYFHDAGCRVSDHSLEPPVYAECTQSQMEEIFQKGLKRENLSPLEIARYKTYIMTWLGKAYHAKGWVMQLHMTAQRSNNTRMVQMLGPDTGYDSISDEPYSRPLANILNGLDLTNQLPKTILYGLNPASDMMLATMIGNFQGGGVRGKIQWGCPWWFNDTKPGIESHLASLASAGVLARFIGMLTDSRSFMSYPRHEYFRRILAQVVGEWVEKGEFPDDEAKLRQIVQGISYCNAKEYFEL